jgi:hypothetical protein
MKPNLYLDCLTNAEYLTHISEPSYTVIISLQNIMSQDIIRYILQYMYSNRESIDLSERTFRRLRTSIINGNFENFQFIFKTEYMQPNIQNWFEYDEESQGREWNFYPLCVCICATDCEPMKVHRHLYVHDCRCENGKRYLAFKLIYAEAYEILTISKSKSSKSSKSSKLKSNHKNNEFQKISDYIIESGPIILEHNSMTSTF